MKKPSFTTIINQIIEFNDKRGWDPEPVDSAKSIVIESAELLEHFQWDATDQRKDEKKDWTDIELEVADVFWYLLTFCHKTNIDPLGAIQNKIKYNEEKYPEDHFNGKHNQKFYKQRKMEYRNKNK
ncbi:nucleotide pyrophosphohydrolase [Candidatus Dojkabacteria bacterium]|nr:nucleotide pyrophosphohydrolase [Candidatus Dojkabacteria bacterium]